MNNLIFREDISIYTEAATLQKNQNPSDQKAIPLATFREKYNEDANYKTHWLGRKFTALPKALYSLFFSLGYDLCDLAIKYVKVQFNLSKDIGPERLQVGKDVQIGLGNIVRLVDDVWGSYIVQKACYKEPASSEIFEAEEGSTTEETGSSHINLDAEKTLQSSHINLVMGPYLLDHTFFVYSAEDKTFKQLVGKQDEDKEILEFFSDFDKQPHSTLPFDSYFIKGESNSSYERLLDLPRCNQYKMKALINDKKLILVCEPDDSLKNELKNVKVVGGEIPYRKRFYTESFPGPINPSSFKISLNTNGTFKISVQSAP